MAEQTMTVTAKHGTTPMVLADGAETAVPASILKGLTIIPDDRVRVVVRTPFEPVIMGTEQRRTYSEYILSLGPSAYYRLGDASGNPVDSSGNGLHFAAANALTYSQTGALSGDSDKAILWTAASFSYGRIAHHALLSTGLDDDFTVMAWLKTTNNEQYDRLIEKYDGSKYTWSVYDNSGGVFALRRYDGTNLPTALSPSGCADGNYHLLVFRKSGSELRVLKDLTLGTAATDTITSVNTTGDVYVGCRVGGSAYWGGTIDELAIWAFDALPWDAAYAAYYIAKGTSPWST